MPYSDRYDVTYAAEVIVKCSRDPETDLARTLLVRGHTGTVTLLDGASGKPRTIINIEKAGGLRTIETGTYPRFRAVETCAESPPAGEADLEHAAWPALKSRPWKVWPGQKRLSIRDGALDDYQLAGMA